jgi:hypothetical protein
MKRSEAVFGPISKSRAAMGTWQKLKGIVGLLIVATTSVIVWQLPRSVSTLLLDGVEPNVLAEWATPVITCRESARCSIPACPGADITSRP